jgi:hypothetical protein
MLNRALQVKMIKTDKSELQSTVLPESNFEDKALVIGLTIDNSIKKVGKFVIGYIIVDTIRQVLVASAKK